MELLSSAQIVVAEGEESGEACDEGEESMYSEYSPFGQVAVEMTASLDDSVVDDCYVPFS